MDSQRVSGDSSRVDELERRLDMMEDRQSALERSRAVMKAVVPAETRRHMRAAWRENLLAVRSLLDTWIGRLADSPDDDQPAGNERENIPID
jgi:hypothetical protein